MINPGFILFPLYIYPFQDAWKPLLDAANLYPSLPFLAVINIGNGPGPTPCPNSEYTTAIHSLNSHPNIVTLGYVHTAASSTCGASGKDICPATRSQADLQADINKYQNWPSTCGSPTIHVNGIFFDEAPTVAASVTYMQTISTYARKKLTNGKTIVYNPGNPVDNGYWQYADYINVFENTEAIYRTTNIPAIVNPHSEQATLLIHTYTSDQDQELDDVDTIIDSDIYDIAGLFITERTADENPYSAFPANWLQFCKMVDDAN